MKRLERVVENIVIVLCLPVIAPLMFIAVVKALTINRIQDLIRKEREDEDGS